MWQAFEEELGQSVAERLAEGLLGPAALFGLGLVAAWAEGMYGSLPAAWRAWRGQPLEAQAVALFLWAVAVVVLDGVMAAFRDAWLRVLEGYHWPGWLRRWRARAWARRAQGWKQAWQSLKAREMGLSPGAPPLSWTEEERLAGLETRLHHLPPREEEVMPTALGNVLAAAEAAVRHRYGLDPIVVWPHLWLVLPDPAREALSQARRRLDRTAEAVLWGLLFAGVAGPWAWWAAPLSLLAAWLACVPSSRCSGRATSRAPGPAGRVAGLPARGGPGRGLRRAGARGLRPAPPGPVRCPGLAPARGGGRGRGRSASDRAAVAGPEQRAGTKKGDG